MFHTIGEKVEVAGVYAKGYFTPKKLKWGTKILQIEKVTLVSEIRDGDTKKRIYSFTSGKELYRLLFDRETEVWVLEELWVE
jgi:hypothetical protein